MKALFTSQGPEPSSDLDSHFGRAKTFLVYDFCTNEWEAHPNEALDAPEGAGIRAASQALQLGVQFVVTGHCGPKASEALKRSHIRVLDGFSGPLMPILDQVRRIVLDDRT